MSLDCHFLHRNLGDREPLKEKEKTYPLFTRESEMSNFFTNGKKSSLMIPKDVTFHGFLEFFSRSLLPTVQGFAQL